MAFSLLEWIFGKKDKSMDPIERQYLLSAEEELQVRMLAWNVCVNMIARAVGRCDFRTYRGHKEVREQEWWLWNVEPNVNQNSTAFLHKLVHRLLADNKVLLIETTDRKGGEHLVVADAFQEGQKYPGKMNTYTGVQVGDLTYSKTFRENEVMFLQMNHQDMNPALMAMMGCYERVLAAASKDYRWNRGIHMKAKVSKVAQGDLKFAENFKAMLEENVKPWVEKDSGGVLPQFEGYEYTIMDKKTDGTGVKDIRELYKEIFDYTAICLLIPTALVTGGVADSKDAIARFMTNCVDPICDQLQEEENRKRYGYDEVTKGNYMVIDTTAVNHFDMFSNAAAVEKLIGSGAYSINDVLRAAGRPTIKEPWADMHYLTLNIATMEQAAKALPSGKGGETE